MPSGGLGLVLLIILILVVSGNNGRIGGVASMTRKLIVMGAGLAAIAIAAPVAAQQVDKDVRCLLAANVFARTEKDPAKRQIAMAASIFYLGRLDAQISNEQLKNAVTAQAKAMPASSLGPIMNDCTKRLGQKGVAMRAFATGPNNKPVPTPPAPKKK